LLSGLYAPRVGEMQLGDYLVKGLLKGTLLKISPAGRRKKPVHKKKGNIPFFVLKNAEFVNQSLKERATREAVRLLGTA